MVPGPEDGRRKAKPLSTIALKETPRVAAHLGAGAANAAHPALLHLILDVLDDNKAEDTVVIDLRGKSALADEMVIASGRATRHVGAIADKLVEELKNAGHGKVKVEGLPHCDWVLIDCGDVIVHLFRPEVRAFYNLEKMWSAGRPTELPLS
ncbi:ribosome silencing factor [Hansschlegelia zhihuaiae]|uniref:Ribosomal silencing factor RsfS n=1 Tax=Hansschlegelia zhihuaiae TaxID=405005 RepID=A0A4Q0MP19_9HYPH|nr:ribosome silencing factor [Hansschlegelia zhihuaiae]